MKRCQENSFVSEYISFINISTGKGSIKFDNSFGCMYSDEFLLTLPEVMIDFYLKLVSKEVIKFISTLTHIIYQSIDRPRMY